MHLAQSNAEKPAATGKIREAGFNYSRLNICEIYIVL